MASSLRLPRRTRSILPLEPPRARSIQGVFQHETNKDLSLTSATMDENGDGACSGSHGARSVGCESHAGQIPDRRREYDEPGGDGRRRHRWAIALGLWNHGTE